MRAGRGAITYLHPRGNTKQAPNPTLNPHPQCKPSPHKPPVKATAKRPDDTQPQSQGSTVQDKGNPPTPYVVSVQPAGNKPVRRSRAESKAKRLVTKWQQHKAEPPQPNGARSETNEDASTSKLECSVARYVEQDLTGNTQADPTVPK